jgi:hypothetical protein
MERQTGAAVRPTARGVNYLATSSSVSFPIMHSFSSVTKELMVENRFGIPDHIFTSNAVRR